MPSVTIIRHMLRQGRVMGAVYTATFAGRIVRVRYL